MDPLVPLTLSLVRSPGRYALLLGSGISRAAGIPTGATVVERLLADAGAAAGAGPQPDLHAWFRTTYGVRATYDDVLKSLGPTPADRQRLIRAYIEPEGAERPQPTPAHEAIARLIEGGAIRIVLTTNFDDLLERALTARGVPHHVIASADAIEGAPPFAHGGTFIFKLHGDYRDERILNTLAELGTYDPRTAALLDRLLDEFGLIVCGWSADSDVALRAAIERVKGRRFATYWLSVSEPRESAKALLELRDGQVIRIRNADDAFANIVDRVEAIRQAQVGESGDEAVAAALIKKFLTDPSQAIRLHDAILGEVARLRELFADETAFGTGGVVNAAVLDRHLSQYEAATRTLRAMLMVLGYWASNDDHFKLADEAIAALLQEETIGGNLRLLAAQRYPGLLAAQAFAVGAFAAKKYPLVASVMNRDFDMTKGDRVLRIDGARLLIPTFALAPPAPQGAHHGWYWSDRLTRVLQGAYDALVTPNDFKTVYNRFEHFVAVCNTIDAPEDFQLHAVGRGAYLKRNTAALVREAEHDGLGWPGFQAGFPPIERLRERAALYDRQGPPSDDIAWELNLP